MALVGASPAVMGQLSEQLPLDHPGLQLVMAVHGFQAPKPAGLVRSRSRWSLTGGLGVPRQETWIGAPEPRRLWMGVGGALMCGQGKRKGPHRWEPFKSSGCTDYQNPAAGAHARCRSSPVWISGTTEACHTKARSRKDLDKRKDVHERAKGAVSLEAGPTEAAAFTIVVANQAVAGRHHVWAAGEFGSQGAKCSKITLLNGLGHRWERIKW